MRDLALQVGQVHHIVINEGNAPDTSGCQIQRSGRPQSASADDERMGRQHPLLPFDADLVEQDVAGIAQELVIGHGKAGLQRPIKQR